MASILRQTVSKSSMLCRQQTPVTMALKRSIATSRPLLAGKESALNEEGRAAEAEKLKQDQLRKKEKGEQHWEEGLASDSESIAKADRDELKNSGETISKLQEESAKLAEKQSKSG
ncbi:hypothetical protein K431DRAFT_346940 [Polychaeton citri CBS 116435]|uniref:Mitochondrial ATPase inhibitor n=1 Tax=Polychaeton citri CBS 116435 TaxID=1314669 RepID=A0A9P4UPM6_9PEZI|nr:hypothetical protein K431DRAFT_346940 [Polychaeton citri CBS 116435]